MSDMRKNTCCFIGHRTIKETEELKSELLFVIEKLVVEAGVDTFLFGSKSGFDFLCLQVVSDLKEKHPHIKRIYVRAEFPFINESYTEYLLNLYDDTFYPEKIIGAGKAVYVERNKIMIDNSSFCVIYCNDDYRPAKRKSGAKMAVDYAVKQNKNVIRFSS